MPLTGPEHMPRFSPLRFGLHSPMHAAYMWPLVRRAALYQREGYRVLSARLSPIQRRAHPGLVIFKRFPCLASLPQELRAATPPGRAVSAWCLSWLVV